MKNKKCLVSILLVWVLVATNIIIVFPLSAPKAKGQVIHDLPNTSAEDMAGPPYDMNGIIGDGIVLWDSTQSHIITTDYAVWPGHTLNIPALDFSPPTGQPGELNITFQFPGSRIDVFGKPGNPGRLITNLDGNTWDYTAFLGSPPMFWDGIYFHNNSEGCIVNVYTNHSINGIVFEPGSKLISPGVVHSRVRTYGSQDMLLDGVSGYTNMQTTRFYNPGISTSLVVKNSMLNMDGYTFPGIHFRGHGNGSGPSLYISDAEVFADAVVFDGNWGSPVPYIGSSVYIEGKSNGTVFTRSTFIDGADDHHYIEANGSSPLFTNCSFKQRGKELTIIANDNASGVPAHPILRNPLNYDPVPFINTTLNATGNSSVTLQWYLDVYVMDQDGNPIGGSTVTVDGAIPGAPDMPSIKTTPTSGPDIGWARGFITTEFILYSNSVTNFNPYNVSADNDSAIGYAIPELTMNMSKSIVVIVPSSAISNAPPTVSWLEDLQDTTQGSEVSISYILFDPNKGDNGSLYVNVEFSLDGVIWNPATPASGSPPTTNLDNNTLYYFIWDSYRDLGVIYNTTVYLRITPWDRWEQGIPSQTGNFTLDTEPSKFLTQPQVIELTDTTATINWTMDEPCDATVRYGLDDTPMFETPGSTGTTEQSVTLTGLQPGRQYSFVAMSTNTMGNTAFSPLFVFYTKVYIQLYKGWNMISIPPDIPDVSLSSVLAPIAGEYDAVQLYDASDPSDPWKHYQLEKPPELNDLATVDYTKGLWIHMLNDAILIPNQIVPKTVNPPISIKLEIGWNFVGYPSAITRLVDVALGFNYDIVQTYDAATGQWLSWNGSYGNIVWEKTGMNEPFDAERLANGNTLIVDSGNNRVIEVDSAGNIVWEYGGLNYPIDAERLANGNTLIADFGSIISSGKIIEIDGANNIVWQYTDGYKPVDVDRLGNGNTLITEVEPFTSSGRVIEVNSAGNTVWQKTDPSGTFFDAERLSNGNTLLAQRGNDRVIEVDSSGTTVWQHILSSGPWDVERLANGNTLIVESDRVIEVNNAGDTVWKMSGLNDCTDAERLSNGNTLIVDLSQNRVIEIDSSGALIRMEIGRGYWIHVTASVIWDIDYA